MASGSPWSFFYSRSLVSLKDMVRCPKCKSILVKSVDLNYASVKKEGEPADSSDFLPEYFQCESCSHGWFADLGAMKLYLEYKELVLKTEMISQIVRPGGTYVVNHIRPNELSRRLEIARILKEGHQHDLNIDAGDWFEIFQDAR